MDTERRGVRTVICENPGVLNHREILQRVVAIGLQQIQDRVSPALLREFRYDTGRGTRSA